MDYYYYYRIDGRFLRFHKERYLIDDYDFIEVMCQDDNIPVPPLNIHRFFEKLVKKLNSSKKISRKK